MENLKTSSGALSIFNTVLEISTIAYIIKKFSEYNSEISKTSTQLGQVINDIQIIAKKIAENDLKNNHVGTSLNEIGKQLTKFNGMQKDVVASINELHRFKASSEERLDGIEQYLDTIINALEEKQISIPRPKTKPQSRFSKQVQNEIESKNVSFGKSSTRRYKRDEEDEEEEEDEDDGDADALKTLKEFRASKNKKR
jgi:septation ring formation regulator EzrA